MSNPWVNESGEVVHPNAPSGAGGPGFFRDSRPAGSDIDLHTAVPHPHSQAARYLAFNEKQKKDLKRKSTPKPAKPSNDDHANAQVKTKADDLVGKPVVGSGECYDLADKVLKDAGAKSAPEFGKITANADYKWGTGIPLNDIKPGDVLQFRNHEIDIVTVKKIKKTFPDKRWREETAKTTESHKRGHHTAIVSSKDGGILTVVEQHVKDPATGKRSTVVRQNQLYLSGSTKKTHTVTTEGDVTVEEDTTVTITVKGTIRAYRPQKKEDE